VGSDYQHTVSKRHDIAGVQLAPTARLGLAVDQDLLVREELVELSARVDHVGELEQLSEPDHVAPDRNFSTVRHGLQDRAVNVELRQVVPEDLPILFEHQADPDAVAMAKFPTRDRDAFHVHWARIMRDPSVILRTIVADGTVTGALSSFAEGGERLVGYWIGREFWGRGVATAALAAFVAEVKERPLHAFVAKHNVGSIRVLEKCEFVPSPEHDPSIAAEDGIHEVLYMLSRRGV
jgi:RimJ/RimL family protein N-acetyltransferase